MNTANSQTDSPTERIVHKAKELGASLAGVANIGDLRFSPSHWTYAGHAWPDDAKAVIVIAVEHPRSKPELDWWSDDIPGMTPGNRILIRIAHRLKAWMRKELNISAQPLRYAVEDGGVFLKDAGALAGLGIIAKNNLLVTPSLGPRHRLRALFIDVELPGTGPLEFEPCLHCDMPCRSACPQDAFRRGAYELLLCAVELERNRAAKVRVDGSVVGVETACRVVQSCRECEYACPVGAAE